MTERHKRALQRHFLAAAKTAPPERGAALLGERFRLSLSGGTVPWCWPTLRRLWQVLSVLPDSAVTDNPHLCRLVRVASGDGFGVYHDANTRSPLGPGSAEISAFRLDRLSSEYRLPLSNFSTTVYHEVGHAVAVRLRMHDTLYQEVPHSPWVFQGDRGAFLRLLLGDEAAGEAGRLCELYLDQPPGRTRSLRRALEELRREQRQAGRPPAPRSLLQKTAIRNLMRNSRCAVPCYRELHPMPDGLVYHYDSGYGRAFAYRRSLARRTRVSAYQFRSPNEWFAELYAVYYAESPPGQGLRRLNRSLRDVADWMGTVLRK